jgi:CheY-like chemotaxis protein
LKTVSQITSVLVVGDDLDTASFLESSLSALGFEVTMVSNGLQALQELRARQFDLVLSEFNMPKMGGEELYEQLSREAPWALPHLCFLASDCNLPGLRSFLNRTGAHCVEKPFTFDQIAAVINDILSEQQHRAA